MFFFFDEKGLCGVVLLKLKLSLSLLWHRMINPAAVELQIPDGSCVYKREREREREREGGMGEGREREVSIKFILE